MDSKYTGNVLLFLLIMGICIFLIWNLRGTNPSLCKTSVSLTNTPSHTPSQTIQNPQPIKSTEPIVEYNQINLKTIIDPSQEIGEARYRYEYRLWPNENYQNSDNYAFYSMYGWRVNPPYQYPQKTIGTAYNKIMNNCMCQPGEGNETCLGKCRFRALENAGYPSIFNE